MSLEGLGDASVPFSSALSGGKAAERVKAGLEDAGVVRNEMTVRELLRKAASEGKDCRGEAEGVGEGVTEA